TQYNPHLPNYIEQAILKAMAKERTERHLTISAFISALQKSSQQWFNEGNTLCDLKRYEEALSAFDQAIRLDPNHADAYYGKSLTLEYLEENKEAQQTRKKAQQLSFTS